MFLVTTGDDWPAADEDHLHALAREWSDLATAVVVLRQELDDTVRASRGREWHGPAAQAYATAGTILTGQGGQQLNVLEQGSQELAAFVDDTATRVQYLKLVVLSQLLILAAEIGYLVALASVTFGASTAAIPGLQAAGRAFARAAVRGLVIAIAAGQVLQVGLDASVQALQRFVLHTRREWDTTLTVSAAIAGTVGGTLAPAVGALGAVAIGAALRPMLGKTVAAGMRQVGTGAAHEYTTGVGTGMVTGHGATGSGWDASAGATDGAGGLLRRGRPGVAPIVLAKGDVGAPDRSTIESGGAGAPATEPSGRWRADFMRPEPPPPLTVTVQVPQAVTGHATTVDPAAMDGADTDSAAVDSAVSLPAAPAEVSSPSSAEGRQAVEQGPDRSPDIPSTSTAPQSPRTAEPVEPHILVDPYQPMVVSRQVDTNGFISLGRANRFAGNVAQHRLYVGIERSREWVDVRFGDTGLSIVFEDSNGQGTAIKTATRTSWEPTREEFSRLPEVRNINPPLPPRTVDPERPMVVTREVNRGSVNLGYVKQGATGRPVPRQIYVGWRRSGESVDIRLDDMELSIIGKDPDGRDTIIKSARARPGELTWDEFSRYAGVRNTTTPLPAPIRAPIDPNKPMVYACNVDEEGSVNLGFAKQGAARTPVYRGLHVGRRRSGERVHVRFDHTGLSIIGKDLNGSDTVIKTVHLHQTRWDLTREEFSELPGVINTAGAEAVSPPPDNGSRKRSAEQAGLDRATGSSSGSNDMPTAVPPHGLHPRPL